MIIRRETLAAVLPAVTFDDSRYFLSSVCIEPDGRAVATDGHVMLVATDNSPMPDEDFPIIPGAPFHGTPAAATLIDADVIRGLLSAMPKRPTMPILAAVQLSQNGTPQTATIAATDLQAPRVATVTSEGKTFPSYERVMPAAEQPTTLVLAIDVLETLIKSAKAVHGTRKSGPAPMIRFDIPKNEGNQVTAAVRITITGADVTVTGAAMPCCL